MPWTRSAGPHLARVRRGQVAALHRPRFEPRAHPWSFRRRLGRYDHPRSCLPRYWRSQQRAYIGKLVWNRLRYVKDPNTGKRVSRRNPEAEWIRTEVPERRIVDDALWQAVKARQAELSKLFEAPTKGVREARAKRMNEARRPAFLLSGLLTCGCCGGKYGIVVADRYGCLNNQRRGTCSNGRTLRSAWIGSGNLAATFR